MWGLAAARRRAGALDVARRMVLLRGACGDIGYVCAKGWCWWKARNAASRRREVACLRVGGELHTVFLSTSPSSFFLPNTARQRTNTPTTLGPPTMASSAGMTEYVTLVSRDGFEFKVLRSAANISGAIRRMLDPTSKPPKYSPQGTCR